MIRFINISRSLCVIFLLCFLYHNSRVQKAALVCFDDSEDGIKIIATARSSHNTESTSQFLEVNDAPCCTSPWKQCALSNNIQLKFDDITTLLEYHFESLLFKVRNKCFPNGFCRDNIWYFLNKLKQPEVSQSVNIAVSVITSKPETNFVEKIHVNSSFPVKIVSHGGALKYIAHLVTPPPPVDLGPGDPVISIDEKFVLVPEITAKTDLEHRQIKNGSLEYLVVNQTLFSFPEKKSTQSLNMEDRKNEKYLEAFSLDVNKQPFDFWLQDRIQQLLGKPTKYFLSSYGTLATNQPNTQKAISFLLDEDLIVWINIPSSNSLSPPNEVQLTVRSGILMTLVGTISDPYHLIDSLYYTASVSMATCRDSLASILSYLCMYLTHLLAGSSEFVRYYDDDAIRNELWEVWNEITFTIWSSSCYLHVTVVLRVLFVCVFLFIGWSLFIQKNRPDDLHIQTAVSYPSSAHVGHIMEDILSGGADLVQSLSETSITSDHSDDSWTSCKSSLCQYPLSLDEVIPPSEDESEDDLLDVGSCPFPFRHSSNDDDHPSVCSESCEGTSLSDEDLPTIIPEIPDAEDTDDTADEDSVQYEIAKRAKSNIQYMKLSTIWASETCLLKGFYLNPHWRMMQCLCPVKKIKYTVQPRIGTTGPDDRPCSLVRLAKSHDISYSEGIPNFGQWIFSGKINPNWVFQNYWPYYTWSTSFCLPLISGTLIHGLPRRDVIYFPGGFIAPCRAVNYRTESLAYQS